MQKQAKGGSEPSKSFADKSALRDSDPKPWAPKAQQRAGSHLPDGGEGVLWTQPQRQCALSR